MIQIVPAEGFIALHFNPPINKCSEAGIKKVVCFGKFLQRPGTNRFDIHVSWIQIDCYKQDWKSEREIISITVRRRNRGHNHSHFHAWQVDSNYSHAHAIRWNKGTQRILTFWNRKDENFKAYALGFYLPETTTWLFWKALYQTWQVWRPASVFGYSDFVMRVMNHHCLLAMLVLNL